MFLFVFGISMFALENLGLKTVHSHVGQEPSGRQFDDLTLLARSAAGNLESDEGRIPFNPMVNAGAIMTAGLINPKSSYSQRLRYIRQEFGKLIGWNPKHDCRVDLPRLNKDKNNKENYNRYNNIAMG